MRYRLKSWEDREKNFSLLSLSQMLMENGLEASRKEATSRGTSRLERLTLPFMSCVGPTGREFARGRKLRARRRPWQGTCAKVRSGGSNKRALIGRWLEGDDDLMRSSPFSDSLSPPPSQPHHLTFTPKRFWF